MIAKGGIMLYKKYLFNLTLLLIGIFIGIIITKIPINKKIVIVNEHHGTRFEILPANYGIIIHEYMPWGKTRIIEIYNTIFIRDYSGSSQGKRYIEIRPLLYSWSFPVSPLPDIVIANYNFKESNESGTHFIITKNESITISESENGYIIERFHISYNDRNIRVSNIDIGKCINFEDGMYVYQAPEPNERRIYRPVYIYGDGIIEVVEYKLPDIWPGNLNEERKQVVIASMNPEGLFEIYGISE